jgi:hypothetical protein
MQARELNGRASTPLRIQRCCSALLPENKQYNPCCYAQQNDELFLILVDVTIFPPNQHQRNFRTPPNVAGQARDVLYTQAQQATGYDLRPLRNFNANMQEVFDGIRPQAANTDMGVSVRTVPAPSWPQLPENVAGYSSGIPASQPFAASRWDTSQSRTPVMRR